MLKIRYSLFGDDPRFTPVRAHDGDACYDLLARNFSFPDALDSAAESITLASGKRCLARTGVFLELAPGWEALVRPRSGAALKFGLTVLNAPGTVDAGYRNEIGVILHNAGDRPLDLAAGTRVAQIAFRPIPGHALEPVARAEFDAGTARGLGGFGSSGMKEMNRP
ncbi:MAG: dUTP diphosphatase [Planctomycetota bacterium]|jgi:dUTP pyrophosphatase|nr:dUTP diphosphatase [Planctomycetota bacterium]